MPSRAPRPAPAASPTPCVRCAAGRSPTAAPGATNSSPRAPRTSSPGRTSRCSAAGWRSGGTGTRGAGGGPERGGVRPSAPGRCARSLQLEDDVQPIVGVTGPGRLDAAPAVLLAAVQRAGGTHLVEHDVRDVELLEHAQRVGQGEVARAPLLPRGVENEAAPVVADPARVTRLAGGFQRAVDVAPEGRAKVAILPRLCGGGGGPIRGLLRNM